MTERIAVIGAGAAGLTAAILLAEAGCSVVLFESRNRLGGRILPATASVPGIELGAEFLHGEHPALRRWISRAGLHVDAIDGRMLRCANNRLEADDDEQQENEFDTLEHLPADEHHDMSFAAWLSAGNGGVHAGELRSYVEGFNAADAHLISCAALVQQQHAENRIGSSQNYRIRGGYAPLVAWWRQRCAELPIDIRLGVRVSEISWQPGSVTLRWEDSEEHFAKVVCTAPLPVLQQKHLRITPMPEDVAGGLDAMVMGNALRVSMLFRERFWEQRGGSDLSFLFVEDSAAPLRVFWTLLPDTSPVLTAWVGGPRANEFANGQALADAALRTLASCFHIAEQELGAQLVSIHVHDWLHDPHSLGAYSYVRAGGLPASRALAQPVASTLFFAGEHTDTECHWGTVHAAVDSAERAAKQILDLA